MPFPLPSYLHLLTISALVTLFLFLKYQVCQFIQGGKAGKAGSRPPEDTSHANLKQDFGLGAGDEKVKEEAARWQRIVGNDAENIPFAVAIMWSSFYSFLNPVTDDTYDNRLNAHVFFVSLYCFSRSSIE